MTETSSFNRQPSNLDYAANTQFRFLIDKLPKTEFFVKAANIPGVSIGEVTQPTPLSNITLPQLPSAINLQMAPTTLQVDITGAEALGALTPDLQKLAETIGRIPERRISSWV